MIRGYRLTLQARQDFIEIWRYTEQEWGAEQAEVYTQKIEDALTGLVKNPSKGRPRDEVRAGYRSLLVEKHIIFYRLNEGYIDVARILHVRMDVSGHSFDEANDG